ncbi:F-box/LRR-repeat protein 17-like [Glandiceps talaboti]
MATQKLDGPRCGEKRSSDCEVEDETKKPQKCVKYGDSDNSKESFVEDDVLEATSSGVEEKQEGMSSDIDDKLDTTLIDVDDKQDVPSSSDVNEKDGTMSLNADEKQDFPSSSDVNEKQTAMSINVDENPNVPSSSDVDKKQNTASSENDENRDPAKDTKGESQPVEYIYVRSVKTQTDITGMSPAEADALKRKVEEERIESLKRRREEAKPTTDSHLDASHEGLHINTIPRSIFVRIFSYLSKPILLNKVCLVCKYWNELCFDPALWRRINLEDYKNVMDTHLIRLTGISDNVVSLILTDCRKLTDDGIVTMTKQCSNLLELRIIRCTQLAGPSFLAIGENCPKILSLNISGCPGLCDPHLWKIVKGCCKLTHLRINACSSITNQALVAVGKHAPKLLLLTCQDNTNVTDGCMKQLIAGCPKIQTLCVHATGVSSFGVHEIAKLAHLRSLDLSYLRTVTTEAIKTVVFQCEHMITLNLCLCSQVNDECVAFIAKNGKKLKNLFLVSCSVTDEALIDIGRFSRSITHIDVGWCQGVTDRGTTAISETCKQLEHLGLTRCDRVQHKTVEELVTRFPRIHYSTFLLDSKRLIDEARRHGFVFDDESMRDNAN